MVSVPWAITMPSRSLPLIGDRGVQRTADPIPVDGREVGTVDRHQVDDIDVESPREVRTGVGGPEHTVGAGTRRNRSPGGDDGDAAHEGIIPHARRLAITTARWW